jgi:hypothetical protein
MEALPITWIPTGFRLSRKATSRSGPSKAQADGPILSTSTSRKGSFSPGAGSSHPNGRDGARRIAYRARDFLGDYVEHCHNTMHEDHAMLLRWDARKNAELIDTPMPTYSGVSFEPSFALVNGAGTDAAASNGNAVVGDGTGPQINTNNLQ